MKQGKFLLNVDYFCPKESIDFIYQMFVYKMQAKGITMTIDTYKDLFMPIQNKDDDSLEEF